jgi:hypothetical protein
MNATTHVNGSEEIFFAPRPEIFAMKAHRDVYTSGKKLRR